MPLFASSNAEQLGVILAVSYALVAVWCIIGLYVGRHPLIVGLLNRYRNKLLPLVLIALGIYILWDCGTLRMVSTFK